VGLVGEEEVDDGRGCSAAMLSLRNESMNCSVTWMERRYFPIPSIGPSGGSGYSNGGVVVAVGLADGVGVGGLVSISAS